MELGTYKAYRNFANFNAVLDDEWTFENAFFDFDGIVWGHFELTTYSFEDVVHTEDDHGNDAASASQISVDGPSISGEFEQTGDQDWFAFTLEAGVAVRFHLLSVQMNGDLPVFLRDTNGDILVENSFMDINDEWYYVPTNTATYSLSFEQSEVLGTYGFQIETLANDHGSSTSDATWVSIDGPAVSGVLEYEGQVDWFAFNIRANEVIDFDVFSLTTQQGLSFTVYDSFGKSILSEVVYNASELFYLTKSLVAEQYGEGTLYISIAGEGEYSFLLETARDDVPGDLSTTVILPTDGTELRLDIEYTGDVDVFIVNITEPGVVRFDATSHDIFFPATLALYDSYGRLIDYQNLSTPSSSFPSGYIFEFTEIGTYYLSYTGRALPRYHISATTITNDDIGNIIPTSVTLDLDGPATTANLDYYEDFDLFSFTAQAGDILSFQISSPDFTDYARTELYNASGQRLFWSAWDRHDKENLTYEFSESGTYYLGAFTELYRGSIPSTNNYVGEYTIEVERVVDDYTFVTRGTIEVDGTATGISNYTRDNDFFAIEVVAGQTIKFDLPGLDSSWELAIFDAIDEAIRYDNGLVRHAPLVHSFAETGTYYIQVTPGNATSVDYYIGNYRLRARSVDDDYMDNRATSGVLETDGSVVFGEIDYNEDRDWLAITVEAGDIISFKMDRISVGKGDLELFGDIGDIRLTWQGIWSDSDALNYRFDDAGTYFLSIEGKGIGTYSIQATRIIDDYSEDVGTSGRLFVNEEATSGRIQYEGDKDWLAVDLEAGQTYLFESQLSVNMNFLDANGNIVIQTQSGSTYQLYHKFMYVAEEASRFYVQVDGSNIDDYSLSVSTIEPTLIAPVLDRGRQINDNVIDIYLAPENVTINGLTSNGWSDALKEAIEVAMSMFESFLDVSFRITSSIGGADVVFSSTQDTTGGVLTSVFDDGHVYPLDIVRFALSGVNENSGGLATGSIDFATIIQGFGLALGLRLPFGNTQLSDIHLGGSNYVHGSGNLAGVYDENDLGLFGLNQGVYTIMAANYGWHLSDEGPSDNMSYGWQATPMALDIAILQAQYGAAIINNADDTTYTLSNANELGVNWQSIWDTGGNDTLSFSGSQNAVIDLRSATLVYEEGGGGFLSYIEGVFGGFTIANGVDLENATGDAGDDTLTGNNLDNVLTGKAGNDILQGFGGNDTLEGGAGHDIAVYSGHLDEYHVLQNGDGSFTVLHKFNGIEGSDTLIDIETAHFSNGEFSLADILNIAPTITNIEIDNLDYQENGGAQILSTTLEIFDADDNVLSGAIVAITNNFSQNNDILFFTNQNNISGVYDAQTGILELSGVASTAAYQEALRSVTFENLFLDMADTQRTISFSISDGAEFSNLLTREIGFTFAETILGTSGSDILRGGFDNDIVNGGHGIDTLILMGANRSDYTITADDTGTFTISHNNAGDDGVDTVSNVEYVRINGVDYILLPDIMVNLHNTGDIYAGTTFADFIDGLAGDDIINGLRGNDRLLGGSGNDTLNGGAGNDTLFGGGGNDLLTGSVGDDTLSGDGGNDRLEGGSGDDTLSGGIGIDRLYGHGGDDNLFGGAGNDSLFGGSGDDILWGGDGDDLLVGVAGTDILYGEGGNDRLDGGGSNDILYGGEGNDRLFGRGGADELYGEAGDDELNGASVADYLDGGDGADTINGVGGADTIFGGAGNDIINAGGGNDIVSGGAGDDRIDGRGGADTIHGGAGNDTIDGGSVADFLFGDAGNDTLIGGGGADSLDGGTGDDTLDGGGGADTLTGGAGDDIMTGGRFDDRFVFADNFGSDIITDFENNNDVLDLSAHSNLNTLAAVLAVSSQVGANVVIALNATNTITLQNFTLADLDAGDFNFSGAAEVVAEKAVIAEDLSIAEKTIISDDIGTADKPVISDDDSFVFVEKAVISDDGDYVLGDLGVTPQDLLAEFLSQAEHNWRIYTNAEGILEIGPDADNNHTDYLDFYNFI